MSSLTPDNSTDRLVEEATRTYDELSAADRQRLEDAGITEGEAILLLFLCAALDKPTCH
jgi:hypothetical protein